MENIVKNAHLENIWVAVHFTQSTAASFPWIPAGGGHLLTVQLKNQHSVLVTLGQRVQLLTQLF